MPSTVIVTGGRGELGGAVVQRFRDEGWRVEVPSRPDLSDAATTTAYVDAVVRGSDRPLAAVVNLVGGFASGGRIHETPVDVFEAQFQVNLRPAYLICAATLPHLIAGGGGAIVCVSSRSALRPIKGAAGYVTAKAAVLAFVDALALEYRDDGVRANAVVPSVIDTPTNRAGRPTADFSRWVPPEQIAATITYLCGDAAAAVSGAHLPVYGRA